MECTQALQQPYFEGLFANQREIITMRTGVNQREISIMRTGVAVVVKSDIFELWTQRKSEVELWQQL